LRKLRAWVNSPVRVQPGLPKVVLATETEVPAGSQSDHTRVSGNEELSLLSNLILRCDSSLPFGSTFDP